MFTRRRFLESLVAAGAAVPALRDHALARVVSANHAVAGRSPDDVAQDADFWLDVQQAFTRDRTIINLNNGGRGPRPPRPERVPAPSQHEPRARVERASTPRPKVVPVCRIANPPGQSFPSRKTGRLPPARGSEVILAGPHAHAPSRFPRAGVECDYSGASLHNW